MKTCLVCVGLVMLHLVVIAPCGAQVLIWHQGISETNLNVRGNPVVVGAMDISVQESGDVLVHFDGHCIADVGDRIILAASNTMGWSVDDGNVAVEPANADVSRGTFSHTRMYPVSSGNHTFYAIAENYVEQEGDGRASIYASLTVKFFPEKSGEAFVRHQRIQETRINVRGSDVIVGEQMIETQVSGNILVRFDGDCYADVGDKIVLAASNTPSWGVNDGNVSVEAVNNDVNGGSFSHSRMYQVSAGNHTLYAVAQNYVEQDGNGEASIYGSLTVEFFPYSREHAFVAHQGISETNINVRGTAVTVGQININVSVPGKAMVHFDGLCVPDVGDMIVLAASNIPGWGINDGNVAVEAVNADQNEHSFSHTRVYEVEAGSHDFYAMALNYVEYDGDGRASLYASLTVEFFPEPGFCPLCSLHCRNPELDDNGGRGDPTGECSVNVLDMLAVANHILGNIILTGDAFCRGDCTCDGAVNILDALGIANVIMGVIEECPPEMCKPVVTPEVVGLIDSLKSYLPTEDFAEITSLVKSEYGVPVGYCLAQNYPNPFNPETEIGFHLPKFEKVKLTVFNVLGQVVEVLVDAEVEAGYHTVKWHGENVTSGVYFYRLTAEEFSATKRMVLMK